MIVFMKNCFLLIAIASFLLGCSGNKKENTLQDEEGTPVINLSSDNVSKVALLPLSEAAAKVEIVSLEVTDESLIGEITKMKVTDSDIWVKHYKDNHVLRFSRSGKFLNKVGKVGQGPEEYIRMADFFVDENTKEVYIQTTIVGVKVYDYEGNYKRTAAKTSPDDVFMTMYFQFALYDNKFFIAQNLAFINKPTPKDSVWSFAWVDSTYQKKKIFKNPAHIGREEEIMKNGINFQQFVNGKLTIYPSGEVYANVNCSVLGNIQDSSLKELLYKEITEGNAWLRIRGNEKPCNQCVNRDLCPSISNYELVIGKNNLCNIPIE